MQTTHLRKITTVCKEKPARIYYAGLAGLSIVGWLVGIVPELLARNTSPTMTNLLVIYSVMVAALLTLMVSITHISKNERLHATIRHESIILLTLPGIFAAIITTPVLALVILPICILWKALFLPVR